MDLIKFKFKLRLEYEKLNFDYYDLSLSLNSGKVLYKIHEFKTWCVKTLF